MPRLNENHKSLANIVTSSNEVNRLVTGQIPHD
ncbi:fur leader peptide [Escherichia sp. TWPC-MK]